MSRGLLHVVYFTDAQPNELANHNMASRRSDYYIANNVGSIHHRSTQHMYSQSSRSSVKWLQCVGADWQLIMVSALIIVSFCGESLFRKSLSTVMYNYRWCMLMLLDLLSMTLCVALLSFRKLQTLWLRHKKRTKRRHQKERLMQRQIDGGHDDDDGPFDGRISIHSHSVMSSLSTPTDLRSTVSIPDHDGGGGVGASFGGLLSWHRCLDWKCHLILSTLCSLQMLFTFIPMAVLPANVVMVVPLIGVALCSLLNCCIAFSGSMLRMRWDNVSGCGLLFVSILLLLFQDRNTAALLTLNDPNFDEKYISNLVLFVIGSLLMMPIDVYRRIALSRVQVDAVQFNLIQSVLIAVTLWLLSPLAFYIEYIGKYGNETVHIDDITDSVRNLSDGVQCLFGVDRWRSSPVYDSCTGLTLLYPMVHFTALMLWMAVNRMALLYLFRNESFLCFVPNKNAFISHLSSGSAAISFLLCYLEKVQMLWNHDGNGMYRVHLEMQWETLCIWMGIVVGSLMAFRKSDERMVNLKLLEDQWAIT